MQKPLPADIAVKTHKNKQLVMLSQRLIMATCGISAKYLVLCRQNYAKSIKGEYQGIAPATGKAWRFARINGQFYYDVDYIPNRKPAFYRSKFPSKSELKKLSKQSATSINEAIEAAKESTYTNYLKAYASSPLQQKELATACAVIEEAVNFINSYKVNTRKQRFFKQYANLIEKQGIRYLPYNYRRLKEKIMAAIAGQSITSLVALPREGNKNRRIDVDIEVRSWIYQLRGMPQNYTNSFIKRKVDEMCSITGKKKVGDGWFNKLMADHHTKFITANHRFGEGSRHAYRYNGYIPIKNALFSGDCWQVDGTRFNIIEHKGRTINGKQQKEFLYIIAVRDVHSGDIIGRQYDLKEDRWAVFNALKMAVKTAGYLPYEIVFDRFPGHNTPEMKSFLKNLEHLGVKISFSHKATAKARVERFFGTLQTCFMQDSKYYYGQGVKSTLPFAHRNPAYLANTRKEANKDGWDFDAAWNEAEKIIEAYRQTKLSAYSRKYKHVGQSPAMLHQESEKPNTLDVTKANFSLLFGLKKKKQISNFMINTEINKVEFNYKIDDYQVLSRYKEVIISYDLENLEVIQLFEKLSNGWLKHIGEAVNLESVQVYGKNAEWGKQAAEKARVKQINEKREEEYTELASAAGSEVDMLMNNLTNKEQAESAETAYLMQQADAWKDKRIKNNKDKPTNDKGAGNDDTSDDAVISVYNMM